MSASRGAIALFGLAAVLGAACRIASDAGDAPARRAAEAPARVSVAAPIDLGAIPRTFHFAFRRDADGTLVAGHASHVVHASAAGFSLAPVDVPSPASSPRARTSAGAPSSPLTIGAATITRGAVTCGDAPGEPRIDRDGSLRIDRGDVVERLQNGEGGVEQSWTFARAPGAAAAMGAGPRDLVVRLPVHGEAFAGESPTGLHFRDAEAGLGVAYGAATFVDARGVRTRVAPAFDGEAIVLRVPAAIVDASAYPATLDPNVSPEREVDQPIFVSYAPGVNAAPAIDVEAGRYFVVWSDDRTTFGGGVFGIHVGQDGKAIEAAPITIAQGFPGAAASPAYDGTAVVAVAFDGTNHLVAYTDERAGHLAISARRVSSSGAVLDASPIAVSPPIGADAVSPSVAFAGSAYVVVWADGRNAPASPSDVFGARVTLGGSVLNASSIPISSPGNNVQPKVAAQGGGGDLFVVWSRDVSVGLVSSAIYGALLTSSGAVVAPDVLVAPAAGTVRNAFRPDVAAGGGGFLVSYLDEAIAVADPIHHSPAFAPYNLATPVTTLVSSAGVPGAVLPEVLPLETPAQVNGVYMYSTPRVAFDGTSFVLAYSSTNRLDVQAISTQGALVGSISSLAIDDDEQTAPGAAVVAASPAGTLAVAHTRLPTGEGAVFASVVAPGDGGPALGAAHMLSQGANAELLADAASLGTNTLVVWVDARNAATNSDDVYGVLLDANGNGVGGAGGGIDAGYPLADAFPIVTTPSADGPVAVAADDQGYLVAFGTTVVGQFMDVAVKRVTAQGQLAFDTAASSGTSAGESGSSGFARVDVCWDGSNFLVVGALPAATSAENIFGRHITPTSFGAPALVESSFFPAITQDINGHDTDPLVASEGSGRSFVVWRDKSSNLVGEFFGDPLPSTIGTPIPVATGVAGAALVYDTLGQSYRLAWVSNTTPATLSFASATRTSMSAVRTIPATPFASSPPALGFDGKGSLVAWADQRGGPASLDVYGARLDLTGALLDPQGFPIAADPQAIESLPVVSGIGGGASLVTYVKYSTDQAVVRRYARVVSSVQSEALGASCTTAGDCASGFCVDGVCCDQECGASGGASRCAVCAAALGATSDGTCTARASRTVCRPSSGDCDLSELCDGTSASCPPDVPAPNGTLCSAGVCAGGVCVSSSDAGPVVDAGEDAALDAGAESGAGDAAPDAAREAGTDAGTDAATDAATDAPPPVDAAIDAAPPVDAAADAPSDASPRDAAPDARNDAAAEAGADAAPPIVVLDSGVPDADESFAPFPTDDSGCGCRAAGRPSAAPAGWLLALLLGFAFGARRFTAVTSRRTSPVRAPRVRAARRGARPPAGRRTDGRARARAPRTA